jgi:hypothetical protein
MAQALTSYPPYAPPEYNPDPNPASMRAASAQYREYFLGSMQARLEVLRATVDSEGELDSWRAGQFVVTLSGN